MIEPEIKLPITSLNFKSMRTVIILGDTTSITFFAK